MLEYMLCRPQDQCFGPDLRAVVLDEAHLYTGTLAAEIALLLRRLYDRCGVHPDQILHVATSATLGGTPAELATFAAKLFTKRADLVRLFEASGLARNSGAEVPPRVTPSAASLDGPPWLDGPTLIRTPTAGACSSRPRDPPAGRAAPCPHRLPRPGR